MLLINPQCDSHAATPPLTPASPFLSPVPVSPSAANSEYYKLLMCNGLEERKDATVCSLEQLESITSEHTLKNTVRPRQNRLGRSVTRKSSRSLSHYFFFLFHTDTFIVLKKTKDVMPVCFMFMSRLLLFVLFVTQDTFVVVFSLATGRVVYASEQASYILNCKRKFLDSAKFVELLFHQDVNVFYSHTAQPNLPPWNLGTDSGEYGPSVNVRLVNNQKKSLPWIIDVL